MKLKINSLLTPVKYIFSSGISFVVDQLLFILLMFILKDNIFIIISKLIARAISSLLNFLLNSKVVFKNKGKNAIIKYYLLVVVQALVSSFSIYVLKLILKNIQVGLISIVVDIVIFIVNYFVQKEWIFK